MRIGTWVGALALLACSVAAGQNVPARSYTTVVNLRGKAALTFQIASPRVTAAELNKMAGDAGILAALNAKHLAKLGTLVSDRSFLIGDTFFDAGNYDVGLSIDAARSVSLRLGRGDAISALPLQCDAYSADCPQATFAALPDADVDRFTLEVRIGSIRATGNLDFSPERMIVSLNNTAHRLLNPPGMSQPKSDDSAKAFYMAARANEMTSGKNPLVLDTLALALFHNGKVDQAIAAEKKALTLVDKSYEKHRPEMEARLKTFESAAKPGDPGKNSGS